MINSAPVVHAQSSSIPISSVSPAPQASQIIPQPGTTGSIFQPGTTAQPCVNAGSNVLGPKDNGKQILNQENQCTGTPKNVNQPPIANAGPSQTVSQGSPVTLDGRGSFAQNGGTIVSYSWVQTTGTAVSLNGANTATPTFTAPTVTTSLAFSLTVTDSRGAVSSPATVTVTVT